jgi:hypothetical protein
MLSSDQHAIVAGLHMLRSKGQAPSSVAGSVLALPLIESTIGPGEIEICLREDGSKWLLGSGSFGDVSISTSVMAFSCWFLACSWYFLGLCTGLASAGFRAVAACHAFGSFRLLAMCVDMADCRCTEASSMASMMWR